MTKTIRSHNFLETLIELIDEGYTGRITMMHDPRSAGIIILMKGGDIYSITGSEREGPAALTQLIKWQRGIVKLEKIEDESIFDGLKPLIIKGALKRMIEQHRVKSDELVPIIFTTTGRYLIQGNRIVAKGKEKKSLKDVLEEVKAEYGGTAVIYMYALQKKLFILVDGDSAVAMGPKEKFSPEEAMKLSLIYGFSYIVYPITEDRKRDLLRGLMEFLRTDVIQKSILNYPPDFREIKEIIKSSNTVIFYSLRDGKIETLPCVHEVCFRKLDDFKEFFKKEVHYVAW